MLPPARRADAVHDHHLLVSNQAGLHTDTDAVSSPTFGMPLSEKHVDDAQREIDGPSMITSSCSLGKK